MFVIGVESGNQCFCGNSLNFAGGAGAPATSCNSACSGNASLTCGGNLTIQVYQKVVSDANASSGTSRYVLGRNSPAGLTTIGVRYEINTLIAMPQQWSLFVQAMAAMQKIFNGPSSDIGNYGLVRLFSKIFNPHLLTLIRHPFMLHRTLVGTEAIQLRVCQIEDSECENQYR